MSRIHIILLAAALGVNAAAQTVIDVHPATNPAARLLDIEEVAGSKSAQVRPKSVPLFWDAGRGKRERIPISGRRPSLD